MSEAAAPGLAPVEGKARIDVLDVLRGIAILGIFFLNIPYMGARVLDSISNPPSLGWTGLDRGSWLAVQLALEGTQRGLLELLFGAGLMVLAARAMTPDGPVAVADLYLRRNLWLLLFGLFDVFVLLWAGDILHVYALAALFLFPFRKLGPRLLLGLGLGFALFSVVSGGIRYVERADLMHRAQAVEQKVAAGAPLDAKEKKSQEQWQKLVERRQGQSPDLRTYRAEEARGHAGGFIAYARLNIGTFLFLIGEWILPNVTEAFCMMLIGIALWKWQIIQGGRSARFYLLLLLACYVPAVALRWVAAHEVLSLVPAPRIGWMTQEAARIAMTIGHVALINLAFKLAAGRALLAPFKAAGRTAFSLYLLQQIVGLFVIFAPWWTFNLWGKLSWSGLYGVAIAVIVAQLLLANLWLQWFITGPFEWAWRSLSYVRRQPFLRRASEPAT